MEQVENRALIEVCLNCTRKVCHPSRCKRYDAARQKIGKKPARKGAKYFARGEWRPLTEWARVSGISVKVLYGRVVKLGWSMERAISVPVNEHQRYAARGVEMTAPEWAKALGISHTLLYKHLRQGWDMERIAAHYGGRR